MLRRTLSAISPALAFAVIALSLLFGLVLCPLFAHAQTVDSIQTQHTGNIPSSGRWVDQFSATTATPTAITVPSGADTYIINATSSVWICDNLSRCPASQPAGTTTNGTGWLLGPAVRTKPAPSGTLYVRGATQPVSGSIEWFKRQ